MRSASTPHSAVRHADDSDFPYDTHAVIPKGCVARRELKNANSIFFRPPIACATHTNSISIRPPVAPKGTHSLVFTFHTAYYIPLFYAHGERRTSSWITTSYVAWSGVPALRRRNVQPALNILRTAALRTSVERFAHGIIRTRNARYSAIGPCGVTWQAVRKFHCSASDFYPNVCGPACPLAVRWRLYRAGDLDTTIPCMM